MKALTLICVFGLLIAVAGAVQFLGGRMYYPHVVVEAEDDIKLEFLQEGLPRRDECRAATAVIANAIRVNCPKCKVAMQQCPGWLEPEHEKLLSEEPVPMLTSRLPNGVVAYSAANTELALAACRETEQLSGASLAHQLTCYLPNAARPLNGKPEQRPAGVLRGNLGLSIFLLICFAFGGYLIVRATASREHRVGLTQARFPARQRADFIAFKDTLFRDKGALVKRLEDIILGILILSLMAIPMLLIAIAIGGTSKGPIIFSHRRHGLNGKIVYVWKFRTMKVCESDDDFSQAKRNDSRVTRIGKFLRKTSLDELPQFINVLQGRMSIVGPRPHPGATDERFRGLIQGYMLRQKVKPGITGWAQINGYRGETDTLDKMRQRIEFDLIYVRNWSIWLDLKIIARSLRLIFSDPNAY